MNIYLTGRFRDRARYQQFRVLFAAMGHRVTSSWLDEDPSLPPESTGNQDIALRDCREIDQSVLLIADITSPLAPDAGAGREWEQGYAWAKQKVVWLIGVPRGTFHHLPHRRFESWDGVFLAIREFKHFCDPGESSDAPPASTP